jgi:hypothetical protein
MRIDKHLSGGFVNLTLTTKEVLILQGLLEDNIHRQLPKRAPEHLITMNLQLKTACAQALKTDNE